jgi:hypothetical protein
VKVPVPIEPVLIAGDPGLHIETVRPAIKVMMIDGIKSYVSGLTAGRPIISTETIYELTERIINPRPPKKDTPAAPVMSAGQPYEAPQEADSRAQTIFNASQEAKPFEVSDFDFAMDEEPAFEIASPAPSASVQESSPAQPLSTKPKPRSKRIMGMTPVQLAIVAALGLLLLCIIAGFAYYVLALS